MASERQDHTENSPWWGEHVHRYHLALKHMSPADKVLDIACGNGFGSYLLSEKTHGDVIGGDISDESITYCKSAFKNKSNLRFEKIDGTQIPYSDGYFDLIVSFETIEHTLKYREMLFEFKRTLKDGGVAIISTPNIVVNSPMGKVLNPYHTQEFTYEELKTILKEVFSETAIFGQRYIRYQQTSLKNSIGQLIENMLYLRGIRKMPISLQNRIMKAIIGKDMYPSPTDYDITSEQRELLNCKTFFAICRK